MNSLTSQFFSLANSLYCCSLFCRAFQLLTFEIPPRIDCNLQGEDTSQEQSQEAGVQWDLALHPTGKRAEIHGNSIEREKNKMRNFMRIEKYIILLLLLMGSQIFEVKHYLELWCWPLLSLKIDFNTFKHFEIGGDSHLDVSLHVLNHQVLPCQLVMVGIVIQQPTDIIRRVECYCKEEQLHRVDKHLKYSANNSIFFHVHG